MSETMVRNVAPEVRFSAGFELREVGTDGHYLTAVAAVFDQPTDVGPFIETMSSEVFDQSLARNAANILLHVEHDYRSLAVGSPVDWAKSVSDLQVTYKFGSHEEARAAYQGAVEGLWAGVSVGFLPGRAPEDSEWSEDRRAVVRRNARLLEVSLTTVPAYADAKILAVRTLGAPPAPVPDPGTPQLDDVKRRLDTLRNRWS